MRQSKLFKLISSLNTRELGRFNKFVKSPIHNRHALVIKMLDRIASKFPDLDSPIFAREAMHAYLFPGKPYDRQALYDVSTYLSRCLEAFLVFLEDESQPELQRLRLLKQLRKRELTDLFQQTHQSLARQLDRKPIRDESYLERRYLLASEQVQFFGLVLKEHKRGADHSLQEQMDGLDLYYLATRFKYACEMLNRNNIIGAEYEVHDLEVLTRLYENGRSRFEPEPAIAIYYRILLTLREEDQEEHYVTLRDLLQQKADQFSRSEARAMYSYAQNYCIKKLNSGNSHYLRELHSLNQTLLQTQLIFDNKRLSQWDYKNIVSVGLRLKEYEWTRSFLFDYRQYLDPKVRENAFAYNMAHYHYAIKEYGKALRTFQSVVFTDAFYHLGTKSTILKIYFEFHENEALFAHFEAFRAYLRRSKEISAYQIRTHMNLIRFTQRLLKLRDSLRSTRQQDLIKLRETVLENMEISNLDWLLAEIDSLVKESQ